MSTSLSSGTESGFSLRAADKCLILLAALPLSLAFSSVSPVLPKMAADLAHSSTDAYLVKMVAGIIGLAVVISGPLTGLFADKAPRRLMLVLSGLIFAIAGAAPFFLDDLRAILATRFLTGVAATAIYIGGVSMVGDFATVDRARWMGRFEALAMFVGVVALPLAGLLGDRGWHLTFLVYLIGLPFALLAWFSREGRYRLRSHEPTSQQPPGTAQLRSLPVGLIVLAVLIGIVTYVPAMYIPFHLAELGVRSSSAIGGLLMLSVIIASLASTQFGRARRVLSAAGAFGCSFAALAVGIGLIVVASTYQLAIVGLLVMGLGIAWMSPNLSASTVDAVSADRRGLTLGLVRAAHSLAPAVGVAMLEPLVSRIGVIGILMLNVALAALLAVVTAIQALKSRTVTVGTERARVS